MSLGRTFFSSSFIKYLDMNFLCHENTAALSHNIVADIIMFKDPSWPVDLIFQYPVIKHVL